MCLGHQVSTHICISLFEFLNSIKNIHHYAFEKDNPILADSSFPPDARQGLSPCDKIGSTTAQGTQVVCLHRMFLGVSDTDNLSCCKGLSGEGIFCAKQ